MKTKTLSHAIGFLLILTIITTGCIDNSTDAIDEHDETGPLTAEFTISDEHAHTLSELTYTAKVTDDHGNVITDLETVEVQRKGHGENEWSGTELELSGDVYTGTYTFMNSGEYDLRVAGMRHGSEQMEVIHEMSDHFEVGRAHEEIGAYRIEYEHYPGHMHEGESAQVKFWVFEKEADASGERPPVSDLDVDVHCTNPDGTEEHHNANAVQEEEPGVYVSNHTFMGGGQASMGMHFTGAEGSDIEAEFSFDVAHGH